MNKIIKCGHNYVTQVKSNQKELLTWVKYNSSVLDTKAIDTEITYDFNTHGRYEERVCEVFDDLYQIKKSWKNVNRIIKVTSTVKSDNKKSVETHYYISNLKVDAKTFLYIIRSHWKIENSLHYVKDVCFDEDSCRIRTKQAPLISTILRSIAINIMNINKVPNLKKARKVFAWSNYKLFNLHSGLN